MLFAGQNIERSPFEVNVGMALGDANKVSARGPGLEPVGNVANKPTYFDIYTAGKAWPRGCRESRPCLGVWMGDWGRVPARRWMAQGEGASGSFVCPVRGLTAFVRGRGWHW